MSNTDKLQEIKSSVQAKRRLQELKGNLYGTVEVLMMSEIEWLISQLEQAQEEIHRLKEGAVLSGELTVYTEQMKIDHLQAEVEHLQQRELEAARIMLQQQLQIKVYEKENERLQSVDSKLFDMKHAAVTEHSMRTNLKVENKQLKADKQKLVEAHEKIRDTGYDDPHGGGYFFVSRQVLSEVKGND